MPYVSVRTAPRRPIAFGPPVHRTLRGLGSPPRPLAASRFGRGLKGLGTMLDANVLTSAWYLPLVEQINQQNAQRAYTWGPMKYLSNWDALDYNMSFTNYGPVIHQEATLYQWDGSQWRKTTVGSDF